MSFFRKQLRSAYIKSVFFPGLLGLFTNPFYFARTGLVKHVSELAKHITGKTLDVGCGTKPYAHLYASREYVGLEIDTPENRLNKNADYYYDGKKFPFGDASFDSLVTNEVFEHVFNPDHFLIEIARVLKKDGLVLMTVPFIWDEHEQPYDFARYSSFGIRALLERHGFIVIEQRKSIDDIRVVFQLLNAYIYKKLTTRFVLLNLLFAILLAAPINIVGQFLFLITPRNADLYLDNIVLARRI